MQKSIPITQFLTCILIITALIMTLFNQATAQSGAFPLVKVSMKGQLPASTTGSSIDKSAYNKLESVLYDMLSVNDQQCCKALRRAS
jgi:hypothetical protein